MSENQGSCTSTAISVLYPALTRIRICSGLGLCDGIVHKYNTYVARFGSMKPRHAPSDITYFFTTIGKGSSRPCLTVDTSMLARMYWPPAPKSSPDGQRDLSYVCNDRSKKGFQTALTIILSHPRGLKTVNLMQNTDELWYFRVSGISLSRLMCNYSQILW